MEAVFALSPRPSLIRTALTVLLRIENVYFLFDSLCFCLSAVELFFQASSRFGASRCRGALGNSRQPSSRRGLHCCAAGGCAPSSRVANEALFSVQMKRGCDLREPWSACLQILVSMRSAAFRAARPAAGSKAQLGSCSSLWSAGFRLHRQQCSRKPSQEPPLSS